MRRGLGVLLLGMGAGGDSFMDTSDLVADEDLMATAPAAGAAAAEGGGGNL
jgi:hypothetical protein